MFLMQGVWVQPLVGKLDATYCNKNVIFPFNNDQDFLLLIRVKEESEKAGLKFNIQKTKIMASGPITSWQIEGEKNGSSG